MTVVLSESLEDYLEAIAELIAVEGHAHTKEIAKKLGVKMPSVTGALKTLVDKKLIEYTTNRPVVLTEAGQHAAERVMYRHQVLSRFFVDILGVPVQKGTDTACHLEHVIDEDTVERFVLFSKALQNRTDSQKLKTYLTEALGVLGRGEASNVCVLNELAIGEKAVVERFGRNLGEHVSIGLKIGETVVVSSLSLDKTLLSLVVGARNLELPISIAENVWVKKVN